MECPPLPDLAGADARPAAAAQPVTMCPGVVTERLRHALLAHPDGARLISASHSLRMAAISELAISTLVARGVRLRQARLIVMTVEHCTVGHVLDEQADPPDADAAQGFDLAAADLVHQSCPLSGRG